MLLRAIEYDPQHCMIIELQEKDQWLEKSFLQQWAKLHSLVGRGYSIVDAEDKLVAVGGVDMMWDGVGEMWSLFGARSSSNKLALHKLVKKQISFLVRELALYRIQAVVLASDQTALRYVEALGFIREAFLKAYFPFKQDGVMYARLL